MLFASGKDEVCSAQSPLIYCFVVQSLYPYPSELQFRAEVNGITSKVPSFALYTDDFGNPHVDVVFVADDSAALPEVGMYDSPLCVDLQTATSGYIYDDPVHSLMNSFDVFTQHVKVVTY